MKTADAGRVVGAVRHAASATALDELRALRDRAGQHGQARAQKAARSRSRHVLASRQFKAVFIAAHLEALDDGLAVKERPYRGVQLIEDATRRIVQAQGSHPRATFVAVVAVYDAATAAGLEDAVRVRDVLDRRGVEHAIELGGRRWTAASSAEGTRRDILQAWYLRTWNSTVAGELGTLPHPLAGVTDAEARAVTRSVRDAQPRRVIDEDGIPLMTAQDTIMTQRDRDLTAAGWRRDYHQALGRQELRAEQGDVSSEASLADRVQQRWDGSPEYRRECLDRLGLLPGLASMKLDDMPGHYVGVIARDYLKRPEWPVDVPRPFDDGPVVRGASRDAAAAMFNQSPIPAPTTPTPAPSEPSLADAPQVLVASETERQEPPRLRP